MLSNMKKMRQMLVRLHKDESGPTTVEWILLIVVGLLLLIGIYAIANWASGKATDAQGTAAENDDTTAVTITE